MNFSVNQLAAWEATQCLEFAVALSELTGYLLQIDWSVPDDADFRPNTGYEEGYGLEDLILLRAYVVDQNENVYDPRGVMPFTDFDHRVLRKQRQLRGLPSTTVSTYHKTRDLPIAPDLMLVSEIKEILKTSEYLIAIPKKVSALPAYYSARYTLGLCLLYAHMRAYQLEPGTFVVANLICTKMNRRTMPNTTEACRLADYGGYFHTVILYTDGTAEDAWGRFPVEEIAKRFSVEAFEYDTESPIQQVGALINHYGENHINNLCIEIQGVIKEYLSK